MREEKEMVETTGKMCRSCRYSLTDGQAKRDITCMYLEFTGHRRGCPVGWCDKYEKKRKEKKNA